MFFWGVFSAVLFSVFSYANSKVFSFVLTLFSYYIVGIFTYFLGVEFGSGIAFFPLVIYVVILLDNVGSVKLCPRIFVLGFSLFVLLLLMIFSLLYSDDYDSGYSYIVSYIYGVIVPAVTAYFLSFNRLIPLRKFQDYFVVVMLSVVVFSIIFDGEYKGRLTVPNTNPIYFSLLCALGFVVSLLRIIEVKINRKNFAFSLLSCCLLFYALIMSGSRGALLATLIAIFCYLFLDLFRVIYKGRTWFRFNFFIVTGGFIAIFSLFLLGSSSRSISGLVDVFQGDLGRSGNIRLDTLSFWISELFSSPFLGVGVGSLPGYPHNIFVEIVVMLGIPGLFASVFLICLFVKNYINLVFLGKHDERVLGTMMLVSLLSSFLSYSLWMKGELFVMLVLAVFCSRDRSWVSKSE
ncbi:O-antigen ligase family protein [Aidingimonas lacisalsi]|uniref:O-antigen ligase family protein n=1 Tax=Aidingimonas lacisalsi TaxID=2604086 RepID=UPI0011D1F6C2|nr:O-antigen ligase family protein [Aidingimonas lacisalsi]